ncbi:MAG: hypothetical protein KAR23_01975, partial [Candidatus Aenigmarchaeota archaeon]|nr:hypothetical protein [Candidatus Aenigmarchaeota archaeon]
YEFDIIRTAQSKIDPTKQDWFDVTIDIESLVGGDSLVIKEFVPVEFEVATDAGVEIVDDTKVLTWDLALVDDKVSVSYSYSVPHVWPYLYALGPAEIVYGGDVFTEARPWYVAVDPDYPVTPTNSSDSEVSTTNTAYVTMKTISVTKSGETWIKSEHQLKTSSSGKTVYLRVQSASDTGINCVNTTTSATYVTFYCELDISSLSDGVQNFDLQLQRDTGQSYTSYNQNWRLYLEIMLLKTNETHVNSSYVDVNQLVCVNHTATKKIYDIDSTWVEITYPNGTSANITTSNTTGDCGAGGNVYGVEINVGSVSGTFTVNTSWANDTNGGLDYEDPYPTLNVTIISPAPSGVLVKTYRNSSYSETDKFFIINDTVFIEANVTNLAGNISDANVTVDILNSTDDVVGTVNLTHAGDGSSIYRGNWTSDSSDNPEVYTAEANATNPYGSKIENSTFHLYSGENVSAYRLDYDDNSAEDYVIEGEILIAVYNGTVDGAHSLMYL